MMPNSQKESALLFADPEKKSNEDSKNQLPEANWKIMIIDDEEMVHEISQMVLRNFSYKDRKLQFIHGYSGKQAVDLIKQHPDTAIILLDVVMETDSAGLDVVKYIRDELDNKSVRIILRTGQPGQAPEHVVVRLYDINDYLDKSKLTSQYLEIALITSLRSYDDIQTISQLSDSNDTLESLVKSRTKDLYEANALLKKQMREQAISHKALQLSEARLADAQRIAQIGHFNWNPENNQMLWSEQIYKIFNTDKTANHHSLDEFLSFMSEDDRSLIEESIKLALKNNSNYEFEHSLKLPSNEKRYVYQQGDVSTDRETGKMIVIGTLQDITEKRLAEQEMYKLSTAIEQVADSIMITDINGIIEYVNPALSRMTGYSKDELVGQTPRILKSGRQPDIFYVRMWNTIQQGNTFSDVIINKHKNGHFFYEEKTITPQKNRQGQIINYISSGKDITERIEAQERLHHLAHHDALTGLPNRILLQDRLEQALARARWRKRKVAVLFIDIDRFKVINDTLGHDIGDLLIKGFSQRLQECLREGDTIARFGGDEFVIILNDINETSDIPLIIDKMLASIALPFDIDPHELFSTGSIGISLFPEDGDNSNTLLKKADAAMYLAKRKGKNAYQFYSDKDEYESIEKLTLETELRRALEKNEFVLHYQPQLSLTSCKVESYEALIRWNHSTQGLVAPAHFLGILEETGMILKVGEWVLNTACAQEKSNQQKGQVPKRVAVNISANQFTQSDFVDTVERTLHNTKLEAKYLELEVTEGILIENIEESARKLKTLHSIGVFLSIDDFGTGYSSMNYLRRLPFDMLKIDRSFISELTTNSDDGAITAAIITLAHSMGLEVIAEGVEEMEQLQFLDNLGCDSIQGYLCSPPLPADSFESMEEDLYLTWKSQLRHFS